MDLCYRMGLLQSIHSPSINMGGFQCCDTAPVLGRSRKSRLGWGRRDLGPGKVQTSNVLQNMKCDESFSLGLCWVLLALFRVDFFFFLFPALSFSDCIEMRFCNFFRTSYKQREQSKENTQILFSNWRSYKMRLQLSSFSHTSVCGNPNTQHYSLLV